jgi:hypothetical protein
VSLPYSPEFEPRVDPGEGRRTLARLAEIAEGQIDPPSSSLLAGPRDSLGIESLGMPLAWMALVLLVLEVAVRRLGLQLPALGRVQRLVITGVRRVSRRSRSAEVESPAAPVAPRHASSEEAGDSPVAAAPPSPTPEPLSSVLDRARRRAQGGR